MLAYVHSAKPRSGHWRLFAVLQFGAVITLVAIGFSYHTQTQTERDYNKLIQDDIPEFAEAVTSKQTAYNQLRVKESKERMESYIREIQSIQKDRRDKMVTYFAFAAVFFIGAILCLRQ
jgi:hypothetical protein